MKTEVETRKELIDEQLFVEGWDINNLNHDLKKFDIVFPRRME
ncbi:hypothetical protein [Brevibacillus centrosporus]